MGLKKTEQNMEFFRMYNIKGELVYCSPSHSEFLGYSEEELKHIIVDLIHPGDRLPILESFKKCIDIHKVQCCQLRFRNKSGQWFTGSNMYIPVLKNGQVEHIEVVTRIIKNKKRSVNLKGLMIFSDIVLSASIAILLDYLNIINIGIV